jgi:hypothetical protein
MSPKSGTVITIPRPKAVNPAVDHDAQPKPFQFGVSWETLLAFPRPMEVVETVSTAMVVAAPPVIVAAPPVIVMPIENVPREILAPGPGEDEAAWEMVVPKMVRR